MTGGLLHWLWGGKATAPPPPASPRVFDLTRTIYNRAVTIAPSDTVNLDGTTTTGSTTPVPCDAIYVGTAGVVQVVFANGAVVPFTAVAGQTLPLAAIRVNSTDTTASSLVALFTL